MMARPFSLLVFAMTTTTTMMGFFLPIPSSGFVAVGTTSRRRVPQREQTPPGPRQYFRPTPTSNTAIPTTTSSQRFLSKQPKPEFDDGTEIGKYLLVLALGISLWFFTIPPSFRRAYICPLELYCLQDQTLCQDCTTWNEWFRGVADYYQNGGGIQWDFSIDPKTLEENQARLDQILGSSSSS